MSNSSKDSGPGRFGAAIELREEGDVTMSPHCDGYAHGSDGAHF